MTSNRSAVLTFPSVPIKESYQTTERTSICCLENKRGGCGGCRVAFPFRNFTVDHKVPRSKGGSDHFDNLQLLCGACNSVKGDRDQAYLIANIKTLN